MKALATKTEMDALRNYLLDHGVKDLAFALDICYPTAKKIAESMGDYQIRKVTIRQKLMELLKPYLEPMKTDKCGNSQIDSAPAVRRKVLMELIAEQLGYLDNDQLKEELAHLLRISEVQK